MPARRLTDAHVVGAAAVLTVLLAGAAAFIDPPSRDGGRGSSSYNAGPTGAKAAFLALRELGYDVERSYEPLTAIDAHPARTALVLTGENAGSEQDRRALQTFLEHGGVALLSGAQGAALLGVKGAKAPAPVPKPVVVHRVLVPSPLAFDAPEITMSAGEGRPAFGPAHLAIFAASEQAPLVTTARVGQGRVVWVASPTPLENAHVGSANNFQLLLNTLGPPGAREVLWDEHYHGHTRSLWSYAARTPLPWIGAQAGVILLAVFAAWSRRSGPVRARVTDPRTSPMEFIEMLLALYRRANAAGAAVAAARARFTRTVTSTSGLPTDSADAVLARAVTAKTDADEAEVAALLAASARAAVDPALTAAAALTLTQQLQRLTALVATGGRHMPA